MPDYEGEVLLCIHHHSAKQNQPHSQQHVTVLLFLWLCTSVWHCIHRHSYVYITFPSIIFLRFMTMHSYQFEMSSSNYTSRCHYIENYRVVVVILYFQSQCYLLYPVLSVAVSLLSQVGLQSRWGKEQCWIWVVLMKNTNYFSRFLKFCVFSSMICNLKIKNREEYWKIALVLCLQEFKDIFLTWLRNRWTSKLPSGTGLWILSHVSYCHFYVCTPAHI